MATTKDTAPPTTPVERIAEQAERELDRLRRARPHLGLRVDRAEGLIVRQLGNLNGGRPIRVAVHPDDYTYRVQSDGKLGRSYNVNPHTWGCDCPDHRRREAACKHALACWVLERAYKATTTKCRSNPTFPAGDSESLRNAVPLSVAMAGLDRMSA